MDGGAAWHRYRARAAWGRHVGNHPFGDVGRARSRVAGRPADRRVPAARSASSASLARRLRRLRIGWGRDRYRAAIDAARRHLELALPRPYHDEELEDATERQERELRELAALEALIGPIESAVPPVPGRIDPAPVEVAPGALASGLATFLDHVPAGGSIDETALERLHRILDRAAATLTRPTTFSAALTVLCEHLSIRVPAPRAEGRAPWGSDGAHLHLADIEQWRSFGSPTRGTWKTCVGTPESAIELLRYYEEIGVDTLVVNFHGNDQESLELFTNEVKPAFE